MKESADTVSVSHPVKWRQLMETSLSLLLLFWRGVMLLCVLDSGYAQVIAVGKVLGQETGNKCAYPGYSLRRA